MQQMLEELEKYKPIPPEYKQQAMER